LKEIIFIAKERSLLQSKSSQGLQMKFQLKKIFFVFILLLCFVSTNSLNILSNQATASSNQSIQRVALILDSSEFYDSNFIEDVLNGFNLVNQTYIDDYDVFQLTNYSSPAIPYGESVINRYPYHATYYYNNSATNHTQLATELIGTEKYDLIVFMGYQLRNEKKDYYLPALFPDTKFLFYDLSGEIPSHPGDKLGNNVAVVSFNESHLGFVAGTLAATTMSPQKIALVGTYRASIDIELDDPKRLPDSRSWQLILGFQGGFLRKSADVEFYISFIDYYWGNWSDYSKARDLAEELDNQGYDLVFTALQNNNTLGIIDTFSRSVISVDSDREDKLVPSIVKNNTKTILTLFEAFNQSQNGFLAGDFTFGLADNIFYPSGWESADFDSEDISNIMNEIYTDIVISKVEIPTKIKHAENTPGFEIITISGLILYFSSIRYNRKKRKR
ncbi:MAG: BMP family ABC transporter substrate-binding protein, partial [Candidatus Heimdallarchaeota archaeon]